LTGVFDAMADDLSRAAEEEDEPVSKVDRMRRALRDAPGVLTAAELAKAADLKATALVYALLKPDVARGRVHVRDGAYEWNRHYDEELAAELAAAAALLKRHGYKVERAK
jgi:hypothetical protein